MHLCGHHVIGEIGPKYFSLISISRINLQLHRFPHIHQQFKMGVAKKTKKFAQVSKHRLSILKFNPANSRR